MANGLLLAQYMRQVETILPDKIENCLKALRLESVDALEERSLKVVFPSELSDRIADKTIIPSLMETLRLDPRPSYHNDPERVYGLSFSGYNVRFKVVETVLTVTDIETLHLNGN